MIQRALAARRRSLAGGLTLALLVSLVPLASASAAVSITPATGGEAISADTTSESPGNGAYTALTGPSINGTLADPISAGNITLTIDDTAEFEFNPLAGSASLVGAGCANLAIEAGDPVILASTVALDVTGGPTTGACSIQFSGLQVRPIADGAAPLETSGITASGIASGSAGTLTVVPGTPVLTFAVQPSPNNNGGLLFATQPVVNSKDQFGNIRTGDSVTLVITPGTGSAAGNLACSPNTVLTDGTGNATFLGCKIDKAALAYRLRANVGAPNVDSDPLNVNVGPADHLAFTSYPSPSTPTTLSPQPTLEIQDAGNNTVVTDNRTITLSINQANGTFSCTGGLSKAAANGVASFTGCTQTTVANGYSLTASDGVLSLADVAGPAFSVSSGAAGKLAFCSGPLPCSTTPPINVTGGTPFAAQPVILIQDAGGNIVVADSSTVVTLAIVSGTPTAGGPGTLTCTGGLSRTVSNGVAQFSGCSIDRAGTGYKLTVTSVPALPAATSEAFNVAVGSPARLFFLGPVPNAAANTSFSPDVKAAITDLGGNVVTSGIQAKLKLSILANPSGGVLTCANNNEATTVNGVAVFDDCKIDKVGIGYRLVLTALETTPGTPLQNGNSNLFNVTQAAGTLTVAVSDSVITWGGGVVITVNMATGAGKKVTLQGARDGVTFTNITELTLDGSGHATFSYRPVTNLYYRAAFPGDADVGPTLSPLARTVARQIALLRPTNSGKVKNVRVGTLVKFTTTVRPARPELVLPTVTFVIYVKQGAKYVPALSRVVATSNAGVATLEITFSGPGQFYIRSMANPTPYNANSVWSQLEFYRVA